MSDHEYPKPSLTADVVAFSLDEGQRLSVLLIQRGRDPYAGHWAIPGGFCEPTETVAESAARELEEETGISGLPLEELRVFSRPGRDPRGWVVSIAHIAILPVDRRGEAKGSDDAKDARFFVITANADGTLSLSADGKPSGSLAFDHDEMLAAAVARLEERAAVLVPKLFGRDMTPDEANRALHRALGETR
ncbi:MAG: NUDIX hydrolase [Polyangiaceae bacterium]|nr:NUDIX hydrolase [Polyangiaceae bacterium]